MTVYSETEDAKIVELYERNLGVVQISELLHHDPGYISRVLRENGVWIRGSRNFTDAEEEQIAKIYLAGHSAKAIMRAYGLKFHVSICDALRRQGVEQRPAPERNRLYQLNPHVFDVIDNEEAAYWLGFLYADGSIQRRSLTLSLKGTDRVHLEKLRDFMRSEAPTKEIVAKCNGYGYPQCTIAFTDRHLAAQLRNLGIVKRRPSHIRTIKAVPKSLQRHFLRGFWDGDGSISTNPESGLSFCGRRKFMEWIRARLSEEAGTNPNLSVRKHSRADLHYLIYSGRGQALKVLDFLFEGATIWLARKRAVVDAWPPPQIRVRDEKGRWV
jgi:hypothetical protein